MKKFHLFDLDGTLIDSMVAFPTALFRAMDEENVAYPPDIINTVTPLGIMGTFEYFLKMGLSPAKAEYLMRKFGDYMVDDYENRILTKPYVKEYLTKLKNDGAKLFVLTASPHITIDPCLKRNGVYDMFDVIWSCDDLGKPKSDPTIYTDVASIMGCSVSDIVFYDDNVTALETAVSAGLETVGVYDAASDEYKDRIVSAVDRYINNFGELL